MPDRIPSNHATVENHRVHLSQVGRAGGLELPLPESLACEVGDFVRLSVDGGNYHAAVTRSLDGTRVVTGAFPTRQLARTEAGTDELNRWLEDIGAERGDPLVLDVLTAGYAYGLREPGERVVYSAPDSPDSSLADIARNLDG